MSGRVFEAAPNREAVIRRFGVMPHWSINDKISRHTYNARSETVMEIPSVRDVSPRGPQGLRLSPQTTMPLTGQRAGFPSWLRTQHFSQLLNSIFVFYPHFYPHARRLLGLTGFCHAKLSRLRSSSSIPAGSRSAVMKKIYR